MPPRGFSTIPLKVKLLAGEQKSTKKTRHPFGCPMVALRPSKPRGRVPYRLPGGLELRQLGRVAAWRRWSGPKRQDMNTMTPCQLGETDAGLPKPQSCWCVRHGTEEQIGFPRAQHDQAGDSLRRGFAFSCPAAGALLSFSECSYPDTRLQGFRHTVGSRKCVWKPFWSHLSSEPAFERHPVLRENATGKRRYFVFLFPSLYRPDGLGRCHLFSHDFIVNS